MVFLHFPVGNTEEELMLRGKYAKLRKKKKALQAFQNPKPEPEKANPLKRPLEPKDAKEYAKKLIMSGKISVPTKSSTEKKFFKKPQGLVRKLTETRASAIVAPMPNLQGGTFVTSSSVTGVSSGGVQFKAFVSAVSENPSTSSGPRVSRVPPQPKPRKYTSGLTTDDGLDPSPPVPAGPSFVPTPGPSTSGAVRGYSIPKKPAFGFGLPSADFRPKQGNTVHVRAKGITEEMCREAFRGTGPIVNVSMELERSCGFVTFSTVAAAERAINEVNNTYIRDVQIQVSYARRQHPVTEIINDAPSSASWAITANQTQKATHKDKRPQEVYDEGFPF